MASRRYRASSHNRRPVSSFPRRPSGYPRFTQVPRRRARSYALGVPLRRVLAPVRRASPRRVINRLINKPARVVRGLLPRPIRKAYWTLLNLIPRGGDSPVARLYKGDVCVNKQKRREVLFSKGVGGAKWDSKKLDMRNAYHDQMRCRR